MKDTITLKGNRDLWIDFIAKIKKNRTEVWIVLELFIKKNKFAIKKSLTVTDLKKKLMVRYFFPNFLVLRIVIFFF